MLLEFTRNGTLIYILYYHKNTQRGKEIIQRMDDVNIIYVSNPEECEEIVTSFLTLFMENNPMKKITISDKTKTVLPKSAVLVFANNSTLDQDVKGMLTNLIPNGKFIMIIIVSCQPACQQISIPIFTLDSRVYMWASITSDTDMKCFKTDENVRAKCMFDCFLSIIRNPDHEMMEVGDNNSNPLQLKNIVAEAKQSADVGTKRPNMNMSYADDVNIIYVSNPEECEEIVTSFLMLYMESNRMKKITISDKTKTVLPKSTVLVFANNSTLNQDVTGMLTNIIPNGKFIMIIIVSQLACQQTSIPIFTLDSRVYMWASITSDTDKKCFKTDENVRAKCMFDCFLSIIRNPDHEMMKVEDNKSNPLQLENIVAEAKQSADLGTKRPNMNMSYADIVRVICSEISKNYYKSFKKYMKTHLGLSTQLVEESKHSNQAPLVALCVQHDDTQIEINTLEKLIVGSQATLVMIIECAQGVSPIPIQPSLNGKVFPNAVHLLYSESEEELYDYNVPMPTKDLLKMMWNVSGIREGLEKSVKSESGKKKKNQEAGNLSGFGSSECPETQSKMEENSKATQNQESTANLKSPEHSHQGYLSADSRKFAILCTREVKLLKSIFEGIKTQCSIKEEFPWISKAEEASKDTKLILVCLKISRLKDDIEDAIKMAGLSAGHQCFLIIIHTVEPGMDVDISTPVQDERILDVANIIYSDNYGCYDCQKNRTAKSKISSWFSGTN